MLGATRDIAAVCHIRLGADARGVAWRLLDEYEPRISGPQCALIAAGTARSTAWFTGDPRAALDEFEVLLCQYRALSGEDVSEALKVAIGAERHHGRSSARPTLSCTPQPFRT